MRVIEAVLIGIKDEETLAVQMARSESIAFLVNKYNEVSARAQVSEDARHPALQDTYGSDFKRFVSYLLPADIHRLLEAYLCKEPQAIFVPVDIHNPVRIEDPVARDERRLKHSLVKMAVGTALFILIATVGAIVAIMVQTKTMPDNTLISTIMTTAVDIIKFVFNLK